MIKVITSINDILVVMMVNIYTYLLLCTISKFLQHNKRKSWCYYWWFYFIQIDYGEHFLESEILAQRILGHSFNGG